MKINEELKEQIISASLEYTGAAIDVAKKHTQDERKAKILTENQTKLQEYATALRIAEMNGDEAEAVILREMIEDFKVVELARMEMNKIKGDRESREALFAILQSAAFDAAKIAISAAVIV